MDTKDINDRQVAQVTAYMYEGDIVYDEQGNITNKLVQTVEYTDLPVTEEKI